MKSDRSPTKTKGESVEIKHISKMCRERTNAVHCWVKLEARNYTFGLSMECARCLATLDKVPEKFI